MYLLACCHIFPGLEKLRQEDCCELKPARASSEFEPTVGYIRESLSLTSEEDKRCGSQQLGLIPTAVCVLMVWVKLILLQHLNAA